MAWPQEGYMAIRLGTSNSSTHHALQSGLQAANFALIKSLAAYAESLLSASFLITTKTTNESKIMIE